MKTYSIHKARAEFSKLVDSALSGEPQRITRYGKDSVVLVSAADWERHRRVTPTLGSVLARHARREGFRPEDFGRPFSQKRPLGSQFD